MSFFFFFFQAEDGIRDYKVTGVQTCALPICYLAHWLRSRGRYHVSCPRLVNHGQPLGVLARTTSAQLYQSAKDAFFEARAAARAEGVPLVIGGPCPRAQPFIIPGAGVPRALAGGGLPP